MSYCTLQDMLDRLGEEQLIELTDFENAGVVHEGRVQQAIQDAEAEVNAYAQMRYKVPFDPPPSIIRKVTLDLAIYNLFKARGFDEKADDAVVEARRSAVAFLERLAKGLVSIGAPQPRKDEGARVTAAKRVFTRDSLEEL
jgi:phage gp36-like protein